MRASLRFRTDTPVRLMPAVLSRRQAMHGRHICTRAELRKGWCCKTGCRADAALVWSGSGNGGGVHGGRKPKLTCGDAHSDAHWWQAWPIRVTKRELQSPYFDLNARGLVQSALAARARGCAQGLPSSAPALTVLFAESPTPSPFVVYWMEQLFNTRHPVQGSRLKRLLGAAAEVWSFSYSDRATIEQRTGRRAVYMPLYSTLTAAQILTTTSPPPRAPVHDALMFGQLTGRRKSLCTDVERVARGRRVTCTDGLWGAELRKAVLASRLVFGTHAFPRASLPVHRINQVLAAGTPVVYPPSADGMLDADYSKWGLLLFPENELAQHIGRLLREPGQATLMDAREKARAFGRHVLSERNSSDNPLCAAMQRLAERLRKDREKVSRSVV